MAGKSSTQQERRKQALRNNLKRRKTQMRELKTGEASELQIRKDGLSQKISTSNKNLENGDGG